jgi:hypothetical protein
MTFNLADQVFGGTAKTFADSVPLGRHGTPDRSNLEKSTSSPGMY